MGGLHIVNVGVGEGPEVNLSWIYQRDNVFSSILTLYP